MIKKEYNVTGHIIEVFFNGNEVETIFEPFLQTLIKLREEKKERLIVFLAAPPGAGKTTLTLFLKELFDEKESTFTFQSISMDGFHYDNAYLRAHTITKNNEDVPLKKYKGIPESFNIYALNRKIAELKTKDSVNWPNYDRTLHDISKKTSKVDADIVLIEGNYLLLDKEGWRTLKDYADYTVFIEAKLEKLKQRLIKRKQLGGGTFSEALNHYKQTDKVNAELVLTESLPADLRLNLTDKGIFKCT